MKDKDRQALIIKAANQAAEETDIHDLIDYFYEGQCYYLESLSDEVLLGHIKTFHPDLLSEEEDKE